MTADETIDEGEGEQDRPPMETRLICSPRTAKFYEDAGMGHLVVSTQIDPPGPRLSETWRIRS